MIVTFSVIDADAAPGEARRRMRRQIRQIRTRKSGFEADPARSGTQLKKAGNSFNLLTANKLGQKPSSRQRTGVADYLYRYYDPVTGRWLSRDPIEEEGQFNLYGLLWNESTNRIDYLGLSNLTVNPATPLEGSEMMRRFRNYGYTEPDANAQGTGFYNQVFQYLKTNADKFEVKVVGTCCVAKLKAEQSLLVVGVVQAFYTIGGKKVGSAYLTTTVSDEILEHEKGHISEKQARLKTIFDPAENFINSYQSEKFKGSTEAIAAAKSDLKDAVNQINRLDLAARGYVGAAHNGTGISPNGSHQGQSAWYSLPGSIGWEKAPISQINANPPKFTKKQGTCN